MNEPVRQLHPVAARHPEIYTPDEALAYIGAVHGTERTLETLRREHGLKCIKIGQDTAYFKPHLDALIKRLAGADLEQRPQKMKLAR